MRFFIGLVVVMMSLGCVPYPIYKTLQPAATAMIVDSDGKPVSGATVVLISSAHPYGREQFRMVSITRDGVAQFHTVKDWRIESMMLHGAQFYFWNWCVSKEGFRTISTANTSRTGFEKQPRFQLVAGSSTPCPGADR